eukprot:scaffold57031_cov46-Phaeocystis_antarctica.AAC.4
MPPVGPTKGRRLKLGRGPRGRLGVAAQGTLQHGALVLPSGDAGSAAKLYCCRDDDSRPTAPPSSHTAAASRWLAGLESSSTPELLALESEQIALHEEGKQEEGHHRTGEPGGVGAIAQANLVLGLGLGPLGLGSGPGHRAGEPGVRIRVGVRVLGLGSGSGLGLGSGLGGQGYAP